MIVCYVSGSIKTKKHIALPAARRRSHSNAAALWKKHQKIAPIRSELLRPDGGARDAGPAAARRGVGRRCIQAEIWNFAAGRKLQKGVRAAI